MLQLPNQAEGQCMTCGALLYAGDQFSGTLWDSLYHGQLAPIFQNELGVQAMVSCVHRCAALPLFFCLALA